MQLDIDPARALPVIGVAARHQVRGNSPDTLRLAFNDTRAVQRFQTPDVCIDDLGSVVPGISARLKLRAMLGALVDAVLADGRNVAVRGPWWRGSDFDDATDRKLAQVRLPKWHVVSPPVDAVNDDVGPLIELVAISGRHDAADDRRYLGIPVEQRQFALLAAQRPLHGLHDVATLAERPERWLSRGRQRPGPISLFLCQSHGREHLEATDQQVALLQS